MIVRPTFNYVLHLLFGTLFGMMVVGGLAVMRERDLLRRRLDEEPPAADDR